MAKREPADPAAIEPLVRVTPRVRKEWKARRDHLELSTRDLARLAGTTHGTVTNVETGVQLQLKLSVYAGMLKALYKLSTAEASARSVEDYERQQQQYRDIARLVSNMNDEQVASLVTGLRSLQPKPRG